MSNINEHNDDLENLFRQEFDGFEADAGDQAWENISDAINEDRPGFLADKMKSVEMPVSAGVWDRIEEELHPARKIRPIWWWGAAASILVAVFWFWTDNNGSSEEQFITQNNIKQETQNNKKEVSEKQTDQVKNQTRDNNGGNNCVGCNEVTTQENNAPDDYYVAENVASEQDQEQSSIVEKIAHVIDTYLNEMELMKTERFLAAIEEGNIERRPFMPYKWKFKNKPEGYALRGGIGGNNGGESSGESGAFRESVDGGTNVLSADYTAEADQKVSGSELNYATPFRMNLTIQKGLTGRISFETGLSYTGISAQGQNDSWNVTSKLHYLGIPLRTNYQFISKKKIQLYTAQGLLLEKGIYQNVIHESSIDPVVLDEKGGMKGSQFSIEFGLGANYDLAQKIGLYCQGGVSYYFKKDKYQPYNIYNENLLWPSVVAGLRYKIK